MKKVVLNIAAIAMLFAASCSKHDVSPAGGASNDNKTAARAGIIPTQLAYYDEDLFNVNMFELEKSAASIILHNKGANDIYAYEDLDLFPQPFKPVLTAIPGDGMNPLWHQFIIHFTTGHSPRQLESDTEVDAAVASGEITLEDTGEIYRCAVVGQKPVR